MLIKICAMIDIDKSFSFKMNFFHIAYFTDQNHQNVHFTDQFVTLFPQNRIMLKLYTMIDIDNSFCLKMKNLSIAYFTDQK